MPSVHAKLSPSAAKRWLNCPGSITLCENVVDAGSQYADEGTACHEICEKVLNGEKWPAVGAKIAVDDHEVEVTQEMLDLCRPCVEFVEDYRDATGAKIHTEVKLEIGKFFGLPEGLCFGTSDVVGVSLRELLILDFKFGYNDVPVAEDRKPNPQLTLYSRGAWARPDASGVERIRLVILQPKCGEPKEITFTVPEMCESYLDIQPMVQAASKGGALVAGEWCRESFCPARAVCPALHAEAVALAQREWANPLVHSPEELGELLSKLALIEDAASALRAHAMKMDELGQKIPGWKRVKGKTNLAWTKDEKEVAAKIKKAGVHPFEQKLISPANARDQIAETLYSLGKKNGKKLTRPESKEAALAVLKGIAERPEGAPVLVPDTDSRPALGPVFTADDVAALDAAKVEVID